MGGKKSTLPRSVTLSFFVCATNLKATEIASVDSKRERESVCVCVCLQALCVGSHTGDVRVEKGQGVVYQQRGDTVGIPCVVMCVSLCRLYTWSPSVLLCVCVTLFSNTVYVN